MDIIGAVIFIAFIAGAVVLYRRHKNRKEKYPTSSGSGPRTPKTGRDDLL